jgi:hypothetical protein
MYNRALEVNPQLEETVSRLRNLAHVRLPKKRMNGAEELTLMRTIELPMTITGTASADFDVIVASGKIRATDAPSANVSSTIRRFCSSSPSSDA